ncbi:MAG TPA: DUF6600 domain-containing protein [Pyrinomonadaceae bacterium]|nr:DUF6600 domain-containing protein [Pyrinomonadaceae bacterium]
MWYSRPTAITRLFLLSILLAFTATTVVVRADENTDDDEYEENARVARVSLISGDVQLRRNGSTDWENARVNFPLVEGDVLATTGADARVEIQIDARNFVRVGGDAILRVVSLRDAGVALSLSEGVATLRLARFDRDKEYFEIDAPGTTLSAEERGVYRIDVGSDGRVRLAVRDGGRARIYSETSGFTLRDGRAAELVRNGSAAGDWELTAAASFDSWDIWVDERERYLSARLKYEDRDRYYDRDVWGAEELDAYGDWTYADSYGWVWRPHRTVVNNYYNWAPYRYGHWIWVPPYGWTWVGDEPWGWAPYHYGRWVYYNDSWCWAPRGYGYSYKRAWWRPALVVFAYVPTSYGEQVCWYPLRHGQRDPRSRHYRRLEALGRRDRDRLQRTNPAYLRAITTMPARQFGRRAEPPRPATDEIARRVVGTEPVRGRLPIGPPARNPGEQKVPRVIAGRPPTPGGGGAAGPPLPDRQTGAARRTPGVPLDNELRRARVYNGREPRPPLDQLPNQGATPNSGGRIFDRADSTNTGVVTRTPRARSVEPQPRERNGQGNDGTQTLDPRPRRPRADTDDDRTQAPPPDVERPPVSSPPVRNVDPQPRVRPRRDDDNNDGGGQVVPRPQPRPEPRVEPRPERKPEPRVEPRPEPRPEPRHEPRPEPRVEPRPEPRPERRPEPQPERRPEPQPERRPEPQPERRPEPRVESRPEPRPEPRQESRPEPRPEPPARQESKPSAPPPQRESEKQDRPSRRGR